MGKGLGADQIAYIKKHPVSASKVWRNLIDNPSEEAIDRKAQFLLQFEKDMIRKHYGTA